MRTIKVGSVSSTSLGRLDGMLRIGWLPDGLPMETPVTIVRGAEESHVLWMHGCVHGNEYCGTFTIHKFLRDLDPNRLRGAVVALPALNITAFQRNQRMSPFEGFHGGDLNRCFPGKAEGTLTEQMAFHIYNPLREYATHFIDFHTALTADTRWALFAPPSGSETAQGMARAFGFQHTLPTPLDILGGSAMTTAAKEGIPGLIVEAGGIGPAFSPETVEDAAERLRNVLRHLGMLPERGHRPRRDDVLLEFRLGEHDARRAVPARRQVRPKDREGRRCRPLLRVCTASWSKRAKARHPASCWRSTTGR